MSQNALHRLAGAMGTIESIDSIDDLLIGVSVFTILFKYLSPTFVFQDIVQA
jgi:hypothetical protein